MTWGTVFLNKSYGGILILGVQMSELPHFSGSHESIRHIFRKKDSLVWHMQIVSGKMFFTGQFDEP